MNWKVEQHKRGNGQQEIKVSIIVKEMSSSYASNSEEWINMFENRLKEIPKTNSFPAEYGFKGTPRNLKSLEVWKMKVNGDFNYKMFTVTKNGGN